MHETEMKKVLSLLKVTKIILVSYLSINIIVSFVIPAIIGLQDIAFWSFAFWMELLQDIALLMLAWVGCDYAAILLRLLKELVSQNKDGSLKNPVGFGILDCRIV
ncbi:hypothetical protein IM774_09365 [Erysipelotrichaceae bacterium RD49]|nr:hypothetical protein [Erysipelotrichaceae bacterium RD49]